MQTPKTIEIFLVDGQPSGLKIIAVSNWNGHAAIVPRNKLKDFFRRGESQLPSLYFLFGASPEDSGLYRVYIGEAENLRDRLTMHDYEKDFWETAIVFSGKLTKAHVGYLESRSLRLAQEMKRCVLENKHDSLENFLSEAAKAEAEEYLSNATMILSALGYPIFSVGEIVAASDDESVLLCTKGDIVTARGRLVDEGLEVLGGSQAVKDVTRSLSHGSRKLRDFLITEGVLAEDGDHVYQFTRNYVFTSPSAASDVILGGSTNGRIKWKNRKGITLAEIESRKE